MKELTRVFFFTVLLATLFSCRQNRLKVNISGIKQNVEIVRFDRELFSLPLRDTLTEFLSLRQKHPDFFDLFTYKVIRVGGIDDEQFPKLMTAFISDTLIQHVNKLVEEKFPDFRITAQQLNKAFKYYQYYYPKKRLPVIYAYVSGFNQSVVTAENIIGISLDKYLGRNCSYYQQLSTTPQYKIKNMFPAKLVSDVAYAWAITEFEKTNKATNVLGNMIHQGKLMYFVDAMLPAMDDTLKIGYTAKQLEWCKTNELQIWTFLIEKKMLYSNKRMDIVRYFNDAPYTNGFPLKSPGRTGVWIGWQIVRQYMNKHPEVTLQQLMQNSHYQQILNDSGYFPG